LAGYNWRRPFCFAWAKSRIRPCRRKVAVRKDGSLHTVCPSHGGLTPNPRTAVLSDKGRAAISAAATAQWQRYRELKAATWQVGRPKQQAAIPTSWKPLAFALRASACPYARGNRHPQMAGKRWTALRCGARRKNGLACRGRALANGRCKFHGGMVTPYHTRPISPEGIERIREASRARMLAAWQAYREAKQGNKKRSTGSPCGK
jgi:hypothetical protein